jgi:hypothetical protein
MRFLEEVSARTLKAHIITLTCPLLPLSAALTTGRKSGLGRALPSPTSNQEGGPRGAEGNQTSYAQRARVSEGKIPMPKACAIYRLLQLALPPPILTSRGIRMRLIMGPLPPL